MAHTHQKILNQRTNTMTVGQLWDMIIQHNIATEDELRLVTDINGYSINTLNDILYARTGYRDWEQYIDE